MLKSYESSFPPATALMNDTGITSSAFRVKSKKNDSQEIMVRLEQNQLNSCATMKVSIQNLKQEAQTLQERVAKRMEERASFQKNKFLLDKDTGREQEHNFSNKLLYPEAFRSLNMGQLHHKQQVTGEELFNDFNEEIEDSIFKVQDSSAIDDHIRSINEPFGSLHSISTVKHSLNQSQMLPKISANSQMTSKEFSIPRTTTRMLPTS